MKSIRVSRGTYNFVIFIQHIISIADSNVAEQTYIRVTNGDPILVDGTLFEIENKIKKAQTQMS